MSMTWMFRREPPAHVRRQVAEQAGAYVRDFCAVADRRAMRMREDAFLTALQEWAYYSLSGNRPHALRYEKEIRRLIDCS